MINPVRVGTCLMVTMSLTLSVFGQNEPVKPLGERLDEVRALIDEAYENIAVLQKQLNNATDAKDQVRIEKLREEIDYSWTEIERLKDLEDMLQDLREKEVGPKAKKPRPVVPGRFDNDTSTGGEEELASGFMMEDGSPGDPFRADSSTGDEKPKRALPGYEDDIENVPDGSRPTPNPQQRPQRSVGGAPNKNPPGAEPSAALLTSKKLRQLEASYKALIEAGELELAEKVRKSMEIELKRLTDEQRKKEKEDSKSKRRQNDQPPQANRQPGTRGGIAGTEFGNPDTQEGTREKSREELVKELEELVQKLQEENKELREKDKKDGDEVDRDDN